MSTISTQCSYVNSNHNTNKQVQSVSLLLHNDAHVHILGGEKGHKHTQAEVAVNLTSAFPHPGLSFLQDPRAAFKRPGTK